MKLFLSVMMAIGCASAAFAQTPKQFVQAELLKPVKAKSAKVGDSVKARVVNSAALPGGVNLVPGMILSGEIRAVTPASLTISFDTPLKLSIRAAMLPGGAQTSAVAQTGAVIGMPGVTLTVDDSPEHASKFTSEGKELQLNKGLQLMLSVPQ